MVILQTIIKIIVREKTRTVKKKRNDKLVFFKNWGVHKKQTKTE